MSQIQKSPDRSLMEDAIALTAAQPAQIQAFLDQHGIDLSQFLESDDLIELLAKEAIAPPRPVIPNDALHEARSHIESQLDAMESKLDAHLSQWEEARAKRFAARLGTVPANVTRKINEHLGGYAGDAEFFAKNLAPNSMPLFLLIQQSRQLDNLMAIAFKALATVAIALLTFTLVGSFTSGEQQTHTNPAPVRPANFTRSHT